MHVDDAIFRLRMFDWRPGDDRDYLPSPCAYDYGYRHQDHWRFIYSYLTYQVMRERYRVSLLGRIYGAAESLATLDGEAGKHAIASRVETLVRLAVARCAGALTGDQHHQPKRTCSEQELSIDLFVAAVWLDKKDYVRQRIKEGFPIVDEELEEKESWIFGKSFQAAAMQGNVEMWEMLLSVLEKPHREREWLNVIITAANYGHQEMFELAFNHTVAGSLPAHQTAPGAQANRRNPVEWLEASAGRELPEMVRYHLQQGVRLDAQKVSGYRRTTPLTKALENGHEATARILLDDGGADPN
ncbi:hypothetical protein PG994_004894 [Apiospora phragmitis]|uniref:Ankyrin repeat protein n=1 Tax=Apiospora phragmitis TaxID=2905665 RepID=A0ABR1VRV9_9PEZI